MSLRMVSQGEAQAMMADVWSLPVSRRMAGIKRMSEIAIEPFTTPEAVRAEDASRFQRKDVCFTCGEANRMLHRHHLLWVSHGGWNCPWNLIELCGRCHAEVHPWLEYIPLTEPVKGWYSTFGMMKPTIQGLQR